ncbi:MAG: hypothetical protein H7222_06625 [Methylotenera sp.]|nr:hypothetical protein [Oligoflexia bacterium]
MNYNTRTESGQNRRNPQHPSDQRNGNLSAPSAPSEEATIKVDGFDQVLEMLRIADPQFRDSLLRRLGQRDPELARNLRAELGF